MLDRVTTNGQPLALEITPKVFKKKLTRSCLPFTNYSSKLFLNCRRWSKNLWSKHASVHLDRGHLVHQTDSHKSAESLAPKGRRLCPERSHSWSIAACFRPSLRFCAAVPPTELEQLPSRWKLEIACIPAQRVWLHINCIATFRAYFWRCCLFHAKVNEMKFNSTSTFIHDLLIVSFAAQFDSNRVRSLKPFNLKNLFPPPQNILITY